MEELIDHQQRERAMILDAEGAMVDLLHKEGFDSSEIPEGYKQQLIDWFPAGMVPRWITRAEFHTFYNWLREVGRDEPEL